MSIEELREYLSGQLSQKVPFQRSEFSEPLLQVYVTIERCMQHGADHIQVTSDTVLWIKSGKVVHKLTKLIKDRRPFFEQVRTRDEVIGRHLQVVSEGEDAITYQIT
jgi:hypothetical protein